MVVKMKLCTLYNVHENNSSYSTCGRNVYNTAAQKVFVRIYTCNWYCGITIIEWCNSIKLHCQNRTINKLKFGIISCIS